MSDTVDAVVAEAIGTPTEAPAPEIVRREDVREQILNTEWQEDAPSGDQPTEYAPPADSTIAHAPSSDEGAEAHANAPAEPPAEAVIGEGATRVVVRSADGKFTPAPDVKLEFQVGDKTYLKSPAELVRMARDGVAGQSYVQKANCPCTSSSCRRCSSSSSIRRRSIGSYSTTSQRTTSAVPSGRR